MQAPIRVFAGMLILSLSAMSWAHDHERVDHYQPKASETLEQAVENLSEYNSKLAEILAKDELSGDDLNNVHQLSYTLEEALAKIHTELADVADVLEEVHIASEKSDPATVKARGQVYLDVTRTVVE
ncbi:DUF6746 family protein [Halopseudomonas salegens]|uniref:Uncharacterized protein n=1 Tax=Halopseudomonas salegens TaxID=1434072 RepID=A0A1H2F7U0_9GAMM|nr:DUF6746 family protein [Halopseudomonas salegens]SDU03456.1 hypothetical protein SAMN05216210_1356 [Halopseudomonas salegens]